MNRSAIRLLALALLAAACPMGGGAQQQQRQQVRLRGGGQGAPLNVVTTQPVYAALAREVAGDMATVTSIAAPAEDPHFVRPKPSYAMSIRTADIFVTTGLDLELWVPTLLDRAGNRAVMEGGPGYVTAYTGLRLLDIPASFDRSAGDVHVYGNPHLHTDPLRALQVAGNIAAGLKAVAPGLAPEVDANLASFRDRIQRRLFGGELVELLGGDLLEELARSNRLQAFLESEELDGRPLVEMLGGWLGEAAAFRGRSMICFHKNWAYFEERFGVTCAAYVEPRPGIPPTPGHVANLLELMEDRGLRVIFAADYFDRRKVESVADRGGAVAVIVPLNPGTTGVDDYFDLMDRWVSSLAGAFRTTGG